MLNLRCYPDINYYPFEGKPDNLFFFSRKAFRWQDTFGKIFKSKVLQVCVKQQVKTLFMHANDNVSTPKSNVTHTKQNAN